MFERFIICAGAALLLMAAPVGAAPRLVAAAQISNGHLNVACEPGDPACQANPSQMQAPDQPKFHTRDRPKFRVRISQNSTPRISQNSMHPIAQNSGSIRICQSSTCLASRRNTHKSSCGSGHRQIQCSPGMEKCHKKKHRHRRFHDFPFDYDYYVYPPYDYSRSLVSCSRARNVLQRNGFRSISLIACGGKYHTFTARKGNGKFVVRVRALSGAIAILRRIR